MSINVLRRLLRGIVIGIRIAKRIDDALPQVRIKELDLIEKVVEAVIREITKPTS